MIQRHDADNHLMDALYDSAIPGLIEVNYKAQGELSRLHKDMDLILVADFMRNPDLSITDNDRQAGIANEVLAGLHNAWHGSEPVEYEVSPTMTERYWEFVDNDLLTWTVVEVHGKFGMEGQDGVKAHLLRGRRPATYQKILDQREAEHEAAQTQQSAVETTETAKQPKESRRERAGRKIAKWLNDQAKNPPRRMGRL